MLFKKNEQDELSRSCYLKDIELPENGHEWSCTNDITNETVPKLTKCYLHCQDGYDMKSGEF